MENRISTAEQLTGAIVVLATFQLIVAVFVPFDVHVVAELCEVITNGPALAFTFTATFASPVFPSPLTSSRAVTLKLSVLETLDKTSYAGELPATISAIAGKVLELLRDGGYDLKLGPVVLVVCGGKLVTRPASISSQL